MHPVSDHPTRLRMPPWFGEPEFAPLPRPAVDYVIRELQPDWFAVVEVPTGRHVYTGLGPVSVESC